VRERRMNSIDDDERVQFVEFVEIVNVRG